ncbi:MAG: NAD(P)-binding domain-containing protein [Anaerolineae bacterium]|nr:NAD(P)-binding domain-containing protein [Anaerolineae bacterium]
MMTTIALFGAAGKIGSRIARLLAAEPSYQTLFVEAGEAGQSRLRALGFTPSAQADAVQAADVVILAVPDVYIGQIAGEIVPALKPGAMVIGLDPAAPHSGKLPSRSDISYFITHPCHPPVFNDETLPEARKDYFGGVAKQNIVCALMQGPEAHYALGEQIARKMFAPVMTAHRVTVEQMAILEPALAETVAITCMQVIRDAMDEAVKRGVPYEAARDFLLGHLNIEIAILFGYIDAQFSDGAKLAVKRGTEQIIQPDWKKVFEPENIMHEVRAITEGTAPR